LPKKKEKEAQKRNIVHAWRIITIYSLFLGVDSEKQLIFGKNNLKTSIIPKTRQFFAIASPK